MSGIILEPIAKTIEFIIGGDAVKAQMERAEAAANTAIDALTQIQSAANGLITGDGVLSADATVTGRTVAVEGRVSRTSAPSLGFSDSTTLEAPATTTVTDAAYSLTFGHTIEAWPFLPAKLPHANLTGLVVKDATTSAVLVRGTDYLADLRFGALGLPAAGTSRNVLVSYTASQERYDLICVDSEALLLEVVKGTAAVRDAAERVPVAGAKGGLDLIGLRMPLYSARVTATGVELVKVWNLRAGVARELEPQFLADQRYNQAVLAPVLAMMAKGDATTWSAMGDSITALQSQQPSATVPNGAYRDRATATGTEDTYLQEGIIGADLITAIPATFSNGSGTNHTRFGRTWELLNSAMARTTGAVSYLNYSIAGTNSDDSALGMTNPARLAAWAGDGADVGIIADGMNSFAMGPVLLFNRIRQMIDAKYEAGAKAVIVWGCSMPQGAAASDAEWLRVNRVLRLAAMTPRWGGKTAAFIDLTMIYYGAGAGVMGVAPADLCLANGFNHPGIRQHQVEGEFGARVLGLT